jgi:glycosyltransferase involved in cell wall biosynthesis
MRSIRIISSFPLQSEPTVRNRIEPIILQFIEQEYFVQLLSPDMTKITIDNILFDHQIIPSNNIKSSSFFIRALNEALISLKLLIFSRRTNFDLTIITVPSMFLLFFSFFLTSQKVHFDIRDLTWEYLLKESTILRLVRRYVDFILNQAVSISVTNSSEKLSLEKNYNCKSIIHLLTNGISQEKFNKIGFKNPSYQKNITVSYVGNIGHAQDLKTLVDTAILRPEVQFQIIGTGVLLSDVKSYTKSLNVKNIHFLGRLEWGSLMAIYAHTDILFASLKPNYLTAVPSKLYEYFSTGKYVIFSGGGAANDFLNQFSNCKSLKFRDAKGISDAIQEYAQSKGFRKLSSSDRKIIEKYYIRDKASREFVSHITKKLNDFKEF